MNQAASGVPFVGLADLMRMSMKGIDLTPLGMKLIEYAQHTPNAAEAWLDVSIIFQLKQQRELAATLQQEALKIKRLYHHPALQLPAKLRLLIVLGPGDLMANTPVEFLVENSAISMDLLYVLPTDTQLSEVPDHDVLFVAVAESDENRPLLNKLAAWLQAWPMPVVNRPEYIYQLSRDSVCELLADVSGVDMPRSVRVTRVDLQQVGQGEITAHTLIGEGDFPLIVRPIDSHGGQGLEKLDTTAEVAGYLALRTEQIFYLSRFVDYRSADGQFRKYRIVLMRGQAYLCHLAVSTQWMVHYLNADMLGNSSNRTEEADCMAHFSTTFAVRHGAALHAIAQRSGLEYLGIDCAESPDGRLLVFEIDSNMIVHAMDPEDIFPYKRPHMLQVFAAFQGMLSDVAHR